METKNRYPKHTLDIIFDEESGLVHKHVAIDPDDLRHFGPLDTAADYQFVLGRCAQALADPRWNLAKMIPPFTIRVIKSSATVSGWECWIDMELIHGLPLSDVKQITPAVADQLSLFLDQATLMGRTMKTDIGHVVLPDLLGGLKTCSPVFQNFIVERDTDTLYFVDTYPLVQIRHGFLDGTARRYGNRLNQAAAAIGNPSVVRSARELVKIL